MTMTADEGPWPASLSAPGGGEGRGEVGEAPVPAWPLPDRVQASVPAAFLTSV